MIEVYCDGVCRGNGVDSPEGQSSIGIVLYDNGEFLGRFGRALGSRTSAEAEYEAVFQAVFWCWSLSGVNDRFLNPTIYTDSYQVYAQVNGKWNCKSQRLLPTLHAILALRGSGFSFALKHVKRHMVSEADELANEILDKLTAQRPGEGGEYH